MSIDYAAKRRNQRSGVTLLEIMIVLAIMALVLGVAAPRLMDTFGRAKSQAASMQINQIRGALQLYYIDTGRYPSEADGLASLLAPPPGANDWNGPYLDRPEDLLDPWKRAFIYRFPGVDGAFDLLSYGRDGRTGGTSEDSDISR